MREKGDKLLQVAVVNHLLKGDIFPRGKMSPQRALWPRGGHNQPAKGPYILLHPTTALSSLLTPYRLQRTLPLETLTDCTRTHTHIPHTLLRLLLLYTRIRSSVSTVQLPATCSVFTGRDQTAFVKEWDGHFEAPTTRSHNTTTNLSTVWPVCRSRPRSTLYPKLTIFRKTSLTIRDSQCLHRENFPQGCVKTAESCYIHSKNTQTHSRHTDKLTSAIFQWMPRTERDRQTDTWIKKEKSIVHWDESDLPINHRKPCIWKYEWSCIWKVKKNWFRRTIV